MRLLQSISLPNNLGSLLRDQGDLSAAKPCFEQAPSNFPFTIGSGSPVYADRTGKFVSLGN